MKPLAILVTGEPLAPVLAAHGPFWQHVRDTVGSSWRGAWRIIDARTQALDPVEDLAGVIVTGSHASVTDVAPWMQKAAGWLRHAVSVGKPVLGLCFGHQLLGHALGGSVRRHPGGPEYGTVALELLADDELLGPVPNEPPLVSMLHEDTVAQLPPGTVVLARTAHEPHAAVRYAPHAWGVQFHPELNATIVRSYLASLRDHFRTAGRDPESLLASVVETPWAARILCRFVDTAEFLLAWSG